MIKEIKGQLTAGKAKFGIVVSRFNEFITNRLLAGAIDTLQRHGASDENISVVWVPGICEITLAAKKLAESEKYDAVICLGAAIHGQTDHYEYVCQQVVRGIAKINYDTQVPTIFGVLTCENLEQAIERAGGKKDNTGAGAAKAAIEMINVLKQI